ncbi:MAG: hypothetical protein HY220_00940 [Candidatus Sungbacteria bacterium]|uniref:Solute-binding protein family 5 domain-containing protein n=1 Tax=Candidatus Sungiibacteriota bacterium TaxID=2750080 RepID=A0A9D6LSJ2_9BACT|nr:hypothetical protein [Candidatus Sungbacteria bacterium]
MTEKGTSGINQSPRPGFPQNPWKALSFRDWLYVPHIFSRTERALFFFCIALTVISGVTSGTLVFLHLTHPVPAIGGIFREGEVRPPERVNPLFLSSNDTDRDLVELIFSKLFVYDGKGNLTPDLAENYSISADGKSYTIALKKNAKWHDGTPLTADDVVFTVKTIQDPSYKSSLRPNWQGVTIERLGDYSVRFVLKQPYSPFLQNLALAIIPRHIWDNVSAEAASLSEANLKPTGSGPYTFKSMSRNAAGAVTKYVLERNRDYYRAGPYIETVEFTFYDSPDQLVQAFEAKNIDGVSVVSQKKVDFFKSLGGNAPAVKMPRIFAIFLNDSNPVLKDKLIRQALALAIPKDELIKKVLGGGALPIESPIPPGTFGYNGQINKTAYDPNAARAILAKAGWKDLNGDGLLEKKAAKKKDKPIPLKITLATSDWSDLKNSANAIKEYWKAIGVDAEINAMPIDDLESNVIRPRHYDALLFGEILGHDPDPFAFWHSSQIKDPGLNIALYHSALVDNLLEDARRSTDQSRIEADYQKFQEAIHRDFPTIFLYSPTYTYIYRSNVKGLDIQTFIIPAERFDTFNSWYIKTKRVFHA